MKLLEQAVRELKGEELVDDVRAVVNLRVDLKIDASYVPDMNQRLMIYRKIADARTDDELDQILIELRDRYGPVPETVEHLEQYGRIRIMADRLGVESIDREAQTVVIKFRPDSAGPASECGAPAQGGRRQGRHDAGSARDDQAGFEGGQAAPNRPPRAEPAAGRLRRRRCRHQSQGAPEHRRQLVDGPRDRRRGDSGLYQGRDSEAAEGRSERPGRRVRQGARFVGRTGRNTIED